MLPNLLLIVFMDPIVRLFKRIIIFFFFLLQLHGQNYWQQIAQYPNFQAEDIVADLKGRVYVSIAMHRDVSLFDLKQSIIGVKHIPRLAPTWPYDYSTITDDPLKLALDKNGELLVYSYYGVYRLLNEKFELDTSHFNGQKYNWFYSDNLLINLSGDYYTWNPFGVYRYKVLHDQSGINKVFETDGSLVDAVVYDCDHNYAMGFTQDFRGFEVYSFNSCDNNRETIIFTNGRPVSRRLIATYDGQIILPMRTSLLHYTDRGKSVQVPVIEPNLSKPMRIYYLSWTVNKDALVVFTNNGIYFSYDTAKTWVRPREMNRNFPGDEFFLPNLTINRSGITDCEVYDTTRGVVIIQNHCGTKQVMAFSPLAAKWSNLDLGLEYVSLDIVGKTKNGRLYAYSPEECQNYYTEDEGRTWNPYVVEGSTYFNLDFTENSMFRWVTSDSVLFRSEDGGHHWAEVLQYKGDPMAILDPGNGKLIAFFHYYWGGDKSYQIFISEDDGLNWIKQAHLNLPIIPSQFVTDRLGVIYIRGAGKVYLSNDLGKSWKLATGYENLGSVYNLDFDESNRPLIYAVTNGTKGMFTMDSLGQVYQISDRKFQYFGQGRALSFDTREGVFFSEDFGANWTNITYNQPLDLNYRIPYFSSAFISEDGHLYVSRKYEGIYKTVKPLVSTQNAMREEVRISPNPVHDYLNIHLGDAISGGIHLQIVNLLGQVVWKSKIMGNQTSIQVTALPAGVYTLGFMKEGQLFHVEKFMKQ